MMARPSDGAIQDIRSCIVAHAVTRRQLALLEPEESELPHALGLDIVLRLLQLDARDPAAKYVRSNLGSF